MTTKQENHVLLEEHPMLWIAGSTSGIQYKIVNESGDWTSHKPTDESQTGKGGDRWNCLTQALHNSEEFQINYMRKNGVQRINIILKSIIKNIIN